VLTSAANNPQPFTRFFGGSRSPAMVLKNATSGFVGEPPRTLKETMMEVEFNHLNHATWECKYHVVFTPKYRKKLLFGKIKRHLGHVFHDLARRKECRIEEGHLMPDHVHMLISIPPKYSVARIIGYMKGKSSIWIAQNVERKMRNFLGHKFWARILRHDRWPG
jgi:putative transposase